MPPSRFWILFLEVFWKKRMNNELLVSVDELPLLRERIDWKIVSFRRQLALSQLPVFVSNVEPVFPTGTSTRTNALPSERRTARGPSKAPASQNAHLSSRLLRAHILIFSRIIDAAFQAAAHTPTRDRTPKNSSPLPYESLRTCGCLRMRTRSLAVALPALEMARQMQQASRRRGQPPRHGPPSMTDRHLSSLPLSSAARRHRRMKRHPAASQFGERLRVGGGGARDSHLRKVPVWCWCSRGARSHCGRAPA